MTKNRFDSAKSTLPNQLCEINSLTWIVLYFTSPRLYRNWAQNVSPTTTASSCLNIVKRAQVNQRCTIPAISAPYHSLICTIVRKGVSRSHRHPPCKAVSLVPRCSSTFLTTTPLIIIAPRVPAALTAPFLLFSTANMACISKRSTRRREYETPLRSRFRAYLEEGHSQKYAP